MNLLPGASRLQVLVDWLLAIRFDGRTLPALSAPPASTSQGQGHLTTEDFNTIIAQDACKLVPVSVVQQSFQGSFTAPASSAVCIYETSGGSQIVIGYGMRTASSVQMINASTAGGSQIAVGDYGMVDVADQEHARLDFVDKRFYVEMTATYPGISSTQFTGLARAVEIILSR